MNNVFVYKHEVLDWIIFVFYFFWGYCKVQPHRESLSYAFHNMAAHTEATPTREGI